MLRTPSFQSLIRRGKPTGFGAFILKSFEADNGVVHVIDHVLQYPPNILQVWKWNTCCFERAYYFFVLHLSVYPVRLYNDRLLRFKMCIIYNYCMHFKYWCVETAVQQNLNNAWMHNCSWRARCQSSKHFTMHWIKLALRCVPWLCTLSSRASLSRRCQLLIYVPASATGFLVHLDFSAKCPFQLCSNPQREGEYIERRFYKCFNRRIQSWFTNQVWLSRC